MTHIPDLTDMTLPDGTSRAELWVGWLGAAVEAPGLTAGVTLDALCHARIQNQLPDHSMGAHDCEICGRASGRGQFFIDDTDCRYVLPNLVVHYVAAHSYKLPIEVERALLPLDRPR